MMTADLGVARAGFVRSALRVKDGTFRGASFLLLSILCAPALAHKLQVFAFAEGAQVSGSAYFAGGGAASGARIEVRDGEGRVLAELAPDGEGKFVYPAQAPVDHVIRAITGDGHQAEWRVSAFELAAGFASGETIVQDVGGTDRSDLSVAEATDISLVEAASVVSIDPALEMAIDRAVARQIRPLREQLVAAEDRIRFQDILGGIGYILGLTGLALWWSSRRPSGPT